MSLKSIFVATDGSPAAEKAEAVAAELANAWCALVGACEVVVATVIPPREGSIVELPFRGTAPSYPINVLSTEEQEKEAEEFLTDTGVKIKEQLTEDRVTVRAVLLRDTSPAHAILEFVEKEEGCSYIVMGNRGHGGVKGLMLGSVSNRVLLGATCPVVIVKDGEE